MSVLLELKGISKFYNNIPAIKDINFQLSKGEILCVLGKNGAGKSTLGKIISGAVCADCGEIFLNNKKVVLNTPSEAKKLGIGMIYEDLNLLENLTVSENILLSNLPTTNGRIFKSLGVLEWKKVYADVQKLCEKYDFHIDIRAPLGKLGMGEKQIVAILKALAQEIRVLIMDEPCSAIGEGDTDKLFNIMNEIKREGISIIYITHNISDAFRIADRVVVINDGEIVQDKKVGQATPSELLFSMAGKDMKERYPKLFVEQGREALRVDHLSANRFIKNISFSLYKGEILGLTGLVGSGRSSVAKAIFGVNRITSGDIYINGVKVKCRNPHEAVKNGIAFLPEDRKLLGIIPSEGIGPNITISNIKNVGGEQFKGFINHRRENEVAKYYTKRLSIKQTSIFQKVKNLSGGNQQKVMISRWLFANSQVLLFDEPTKGIDVASKVEVYNIMNELTREGKAILFISSNMSELLGMSDRILVIKDGALVKTLKRDEATKEKIMRYASYNEQEDPA